LGCDIHLITEVKKNGKWIVNDNKIFTYWDGSLKDSPFEVRNYKTFAFLAGVRNSYVIAPISKLRGLPCDSEYLNCEHVDNYFGEETPVTLYEDILEDLDYHSYSFLTLKELLDFNYNSMATKKETYEEFLGECFFEDVDDIKALGDPENVRIIFYFDN